MEKRRQAVLDRREGKFRTENDKEYYNRQLREHEYAPVEDNLDRFNDRIGGIIMYDENGRAIIHN